MKYNIAELGGGNVLITQSDNLAGEKNHVAIGPVRKYPGTGLIEDLFVSPESRGRGEGTLLALQAIQYARERKMKSVMVEVKTDNIASFNLFEKLGFQVEGQMIEASDGNYYTMTKSIEE